VPGNSKTFCVGGINGGIIGGVVIDTIPFLIKKKM
jgi:hypothetical protein